MEGFLRTVPCPEVHTGRDNKTGLLYRPAAQVKSWNRSLSRKFGVPTEAALRIHGNVAALNLNGFP